MTGGRSRPKQPRTPNDRIRPGSPHSKQQTLPASKRQHQFDSRLNRRYPPCSILGMRPFTAGSPHRLQSHQQSALPGSPTVSASCGLTQPESPKNEPAPGWTAARFTPQQAADTFAVRFVHRIPSAFDPIVPSHSRIGQR
jgi:hypothetical protein